MKNLILSIFMISLMLSAMPFTNAVDEEAELRIKVTYFANYLNGSITDQIFVGSDEDPIGSGDVTLQLTNDGEAILDDPESSDDVPGLHVIRGEDEIGPFVDITAYGHNGSESRESIKFDAILINSHIVEFSVENVNGRGGYNNPFTDGCGIIEEDGDAENDMPTNDDVEQTSNRRLKLCSITSDRSDSVRIYYNIGPSPLEITNIVTNPSLPLETEGEAVDIEVDFDSNRFPLDVEFELRESGGMLVDTQPPIMVESDSDLPVVYSLPGGLDDETYSLFMVVMDGRGNEVVINLGVIIVDDEDDDGDSDRRVPRSGPVTYESVRHETLSAPQYIVLEDESITLSKAKSGLDWLMIWIMVLLALLIILAVLAIVAVLR